jgi:hypothetical protein
MMGVSHFAAKGKSRLDQSQNCVRTPKHYTSPPLHSSSRRNVKWRIPHDITGFVELPPRRTPPWLARKMLSRSILRNTQFPRCTWQTSSHVLLSRGNSFRRLQSPIVRIFATTPRHRKDATRIPQPQSTTGPKPEEPESVKPESLQTPKQATPAVGNKQDVLLAEKTVSNAEQRKADWAILKEMTQYLWPKVGHNEEYWMVHSI